MLNSFSSNQNMNLDSAEYLRGAYAHMKQQFPEEYHRDPSSLLPWAITDNGDGISWVLRGHNSGDWQTVIHGGDQAEEEVYDCHGVGIIECILTGYMKSGLLPEDFIAGIKEFHPIRYIFFRVSVQAIVGSISSRKRTESQPAEIAQLFSGSALRSASHLTLRHLLIWKIWN